MGVKDSDTQPPRSMAVHMLGLYLMVAFMLSLSWLLGTLSFSFLWVFAIIFGLFAFWISYLRSNFNRIIDNHKTYFMRKKALRQEETAEWLNFILNRWWVFSSVSIEDLVKRRINERLSSLKPSFVEKLHLSSFTFGDITPSIRNVKVFECTDGVPGFKPASWSNIVQPPAGLGKMSSYQLVLEALVWSRCDEFNMTFSTRVGSQRAGLPFDISVEELQIKGTLQIVLHLSMEAVFPHITKATVSFIENPEVWFNVKVLRALNLMEVPLLKSWLHLNIMEGLTKALVDPGKIDIPIAKVGPINAGQFLPQRPQPPAQGVLTVYLKGTPAPSAGEELCYKRLTLGKSKRQTVEVPATQSWKDCCSFFVYDLSKDKLKVKSKCKRLLTTVTLEQQELHLSAFPFQVKKQVDHEIENKDGSKISLTMDYSPLPTIDLDENLEPVNVLQRSGVLYVCVHCANDVIASDRTGSSDPYCVVFCDRRRVLTTPYITQTRNPSWESFTEFFVKDFTQCHLSFYVFDWDGTNAVNDDFLGSAIYNLSEFNAACLGSNPEGVRDLQDSNHHMQIYSSYDFAIAVIFARKEPTVSHKSLVLGYNKQGQGPITDLSLGQITVSVVFRPVASVERSERYRLTSTDTPLYTNNEFLYVEDMVSPGTVVKFGKKKKKQKGGGIKLSKTQSSTKDTDILEDKVFVDLTLIQGRDLVAKDRNGFSDPFCEVKLGDNKVFSTKVKKRTLTPEWNESVTIQMTEESGMLEIQMYDKDMFVNDFMGKVLLTLDQLKELSLQGTSEWFPLQHIKSGEIQLRCVVTAKDTIKQRGDSVRGETNVSQNSSIKDDRPPSSPDTIHSESVRPLSMESGVFVKQEAQISKISPDQHKKGPINDTYYDNNNSLALKTSPPKTSTPYKNNLGSSPLRRSASDVKIERRSRSNSLNSFAAFNGTDISTVVADPEPHTPPPVSREGNTADGAEKLYNVYGKVLSVQGLNFSEGLIYCKVRAHTPHRHRIKQIFGNRVIAKSTLVRALEPVFNTSFEIDRGLGVSGDLLLKFEVKKEGKEVLAAREFPLRSLFNGPGGEGDKVQKVLPLDNNIQIEVYLQHSVPDGNVVRRRSGKKGTLQRSFKQ